MAELSTDNVAPAGDVLPPESEARQSVEPAPTASEPAGSPRRPARRFSPRGTIVGAGILAVLLLFAQTPPGLALLRGMGVLPKPDHYTVLAFVPSEVPPQSAIRGTHVSFAFTVGDQEGTANDYTWRVVESTDGGPSVQTDSGKLRLADAATGTVTADALLPGSGKRVVITVELLGSGQVIHYAVELKGST